MSASSGSFRPGRILVVEDDSDTVEMYATYLQGLGHEVIATDTATQGLELAQELSPDLLVVDLGLPQLDGISLIERLRSQDRWVIPVIVVSGYADEQTQQRALAAGCDRFLSKPCAPMDLGHAIEEILQARPRTRSAGA